MSRELHDPPSGDVKVRGKIRLAGYSARFYHTPDSVLGHHNQAARKYPLRGEF